MDFTSSSVIYNLFLKYNNNVDTDKIFEWYGKICSVSLEYKVSEVIDFIRSKRYLEFIDRYKVSCIKSDEELFKLLGALQFDTIRRKTREVIDYLAYALNGECNCMEIFVSIPIFYDINYDFFRDKEDLPIQSHRILLQLIDNNFFSSNTKHWLATHYEVRSDYDLWDIEKDVEAIPVELAYAVGDFNQPRCLVIYRNKFYIKISPPLTSLAKLKEIEEKYARSIIKYEYPFSYPSPEYFSYMSLYNPEIIGKMLYVKIQISHFELRHWEEMLKINILLQHFLPATGLGIDKKIDLYKMIPYDRKYLPVENFKRKHWKKLLNL